MKAKQLIEKLSQLPPDQEVVIINAMGYPAYDYEGQQFVCGFNKEKAAITIESEKQ